MVAALAFFLGKDEENKDKEDSDSDQEVQHSRTHDCIITSHFQLFFNPLSFYPGGAGGFE